MRPRSAQGTHRGAEAILGRRTAERDQLGAVLRRGPQKLRGVDRRTRAQCALTYRRQDADRDGTERRIVLQRAPELGARDVRTVHVDEERAGTDAERDELERGTAVARAQYVCAVGDESIAKRVAGLAFVVDQDEGMAMPAHSLAIPRDLSRA